MRDNRVDILRFVGLAMIILAHVNPPYALFQLRNFDVPLMVLVSGMSFALSYRSAEPYLQYLWKRFKRLVLPVWVFLTGYFLALAWVNPESDELAVETIASSFALIDGIGYVWIIKVFLLVALVSPALYLIHVKVHSTWRYSALLAGLLLIYEAVRFLTWPHIQEGMGESIALVTHYIVPYGLVFAFGLRMLSLSRAQLVLCLGVILATFGAIATALYLEYGYLVPTQRFKYPPSSYYLAYAMAVACMLWLLCRWIELLLVKIRLMPLVLFMAQNSIWIYLWHIPLVKGVEAHFAVKYALVLGLATMTTFVQVRFIAWIDGRLTNESTRKNLRMIFTG